MTRLRPLVCMLLTIAMVFASVASLWAATAHMAPIVAQMHAGMDQMAGMSDCERMMQSQASERPDCDKTCADKFCLAKCFKVFGGLPNIGAFVALVREPTRLLTADRLLHWSEQPPLAPPRT